MKKFIFALVGLIFIPTAALAQDSGNPPPTPASDCPPQFAVCLTPDQRDKVVAAVKELDDIKNSKAEITVKEPVEIVQDWKGRIYVNGGDKKPLELKLKIGKTIDRDMEMTLPTHVYQRPAPPDPPFRARFRAQMGLLVPEIIQSIRDKHLQFFWDAGIALDFLHYDALNVSAYVGAQSLGGFIGADITKNFGLSVGPVLVYQSLKPSLWTGAYFAFN